MIMRSPWGRTAPVKDISQSRISVFADIVEVTEHREIREQGKNVKKKLGGIKVKGQGCQIPRLMNAKLAVGGIEVEANEDKVKGNGCQLQLETAKLSRFARLAAAGFSLWQCSYQAKCSCYPAQLCQRWTAS